MRTIRGTVAASFVLRNEFTTIHDLETEGAMRAEVAIKQAVQKGDVERPRVAVATRAPATTGSYPLLGFPFEYKDEAGRPHPIDHDRRFVMKGGSVVLDELSAGR
jgi:hypothetical protein